MNTISFEMQGMSSRDQYVLLRDTVMPRPIAWVSTLDEEGIPNLAPFSFFNVMCAAPPLLGFSVGPAHEDFEAEIPGKKDTLQNVLATGELVINLVPENLLEPMVLSSDPLLPGENEFTHAGLTALPSVKVRPYRVEGAPVAFECRKHEVIKLGSHHLILGEVLYVHIREELYLGTQREAANRVDMLRQPETRLLSRLDRANYGLLREVVMRMRKGGPAQS
jgi:flavin reductase (DIM6/NTAB) family NADH-FMN oxidoreductase RutF